jgi:peptidoglycan/LPS O-acetylase OafA/YrhL
MKSACMSPKTKDLSFHMAKSSIFDARSVVHSAGVLPNLILMANEHRYLHNLTPLRGIAAMWVATYHFGSLLKLLPPKQTMLIEKGYLMVDLFFIMSGFIMRHVYAASFADKITETNCRRFIVARFARIYPLHLFTLFVLILMTYISGNWNPVNDPHAILTNVFMLQSMGLERLSTWNRPSWSLSAEWAAYMVFPILALFMSRKKRLSRLVLPIGIAIAYFSLVYLIPPAGIGNADRLVLHKLDVTYDYGYIRGIAGFTLGMLCYGLYLDDRIRAFLSKDTAAVILIATALIGMHLGINDLFLILPFAGITGCFAANSGYIHKICNTGALQFLGKVSYSIYLVQWIATDLFTAGFRRFHLNVVFFPRVGPPSFLERLAVTLLFLFFLVLLSGFSYNIIENPCRNFINRTFIKTSRPAAQ